MAAVARHMSKLWIAVGALGLTLAFAPACGGDDEDSSDAGDEEDGEPCPSPGFTETGCMCANTALGKRVCQANGFWEACRCPPVNQQCVEGQDVECFPCPGEAKGRLTKCLMGGTFDCACDARSGTGGRDSGT